MSRFKNRASQHPLIKALINEKFNDCIKSFTVNTTTVPLTNTIVSVDIFVSQDEMKQIMKVNVGEMKKLIKHRKKVSQVNKLKKEGLKLVEDELGK